MTDRPATDGVNEDAAANRGGIAEHCAPDPLTSIRSAYTLASPHESNANEVDSLMVKHFLDTLAEVALAIASRQVKPWTP